jgi:penicillin-binding protein 1C
VRLRLEAGHGEPARVEWFLRGTEPDTRRWQPALPRTAILVPADGGIYAIDPDIPAGSRQLHFQARHLPAGSRWRLDDRPHDGEIWLPTPGPHRLQLVDPAGVVLDEVRFEVR